MSKKWNKADAFHEKAYEDDIKAMNRLALFAY